MVKHETYKSDMKWQIWGIITEINQLFFNIILRCLSIYSNLPKKNSTILSNFYYYELLNSYYELLNSVLYYIYYGLWLQLNV